MKFIELFQKNLVKVSRVIRRSLIRYSKNPRPASYPYITGDGFRQMADHIYDNSSNNFDPALVKENDIVFIGDSNIKKFLRSFHSQIKNRYIAISHNGDEQIDEETVNFFDEKIIKWYGINVVVSHPKVVPLPLGIENLHYYVNGIPKIFDQVIKKSYPKKNRVFYAFSVHTNREERGPAYGFCRQYPLAETITQWMTFKPYLRLLARYKFVVSPPGSSVEGHRTWDALYSGAVPIVKRSITTTSFQKIGLPLWLVDDYKELIGVTESELAQKYEALQPGFNHSALYFDYWKDRIKKHI